MKPVSVNTKEFEDKIRDFKGLEGESGSLVRGSYIMNTVKKIVFEETASSNLKLQGSNKTKNFEALKSAIRYIVEHILELTPEEFDAIYSSTLIRKTCLDHPIRKLVAAAPADVQAETLFNGKKILFRLCWPEYYKEHYSKPKAWDIFDASGEIKSNLIRAGRIKDYTDDADSDGAKMTTNGKFSSERVEKKRSFGHGDEVDKTVYWAMTEVFNYCEIKTSDLFMALAKPKESGFSKFGFVSVIEARECYQTPLDFYMMNSPQEFQLAHFHEYMDARKKAKIPSNPVLELFYEAYMRVYGTDTNYDKDDREQADGFSKEGR